VLFGGAGVVGLAGCTATLGPREGAVDQAERISALETEVATLRVRLAETTAELQTARNPDRGPGAVDGAAVPRPHKVVDASGSAVRPGAGPDGADLLQWRVRTEDVRGRFIQTTGPAELVAVTISDVGSPVELGRWSIEPEAWREALREGLLGTAYAVDLPLTDVPSDAQFLLVRLTLSDVRLTEPMRLETPIPVIRPLPEGRR
jgi:hypothetical protein